jgi:hypothetical protein
MSVTYHAEMAQGSDEWLAARCGLLTASEVGLILTPTLKIAANDKSRAHEYELLAQRITGHVEPRYVTDDMLRGHEDEITARFLYSQHRAPVTECGFVTNDSFGFTIGCSPDGLVGDDGLIEIKSRRQKYQAQTLIEHAPFGTIPPEYVLQVQCAMLVTGRSWCDFISYCGGMPMAVIRVEPDPKTQEAIIEAAATFEARLSDRRAIYDSAAAGMIPTERRIEQEIWI